MRKYLVFTGLALFAISLLMAQSDKSVQLGRTGATPNSVKAKSKNRVVWTGNNWKVTFNDKSPCQNGKMTFASTETGQNRSCTISVTCNATDKSGCGKYKYTSQADGGQPIDPEIEVEP
jgi:hypothetical protein